MYIKAIAALFSRLNVAIFTNLKKGQVTLNYERIF